MKTEELKSKALKSLNKIKIFVSLYKFELSLILFVLAGTIMEMLLYSGGQSYIWGLIWLLPIYGVYKQEKRLTST